MWWLKDVKDSDKVGLMILYTGLFVTALATGCYLLVVFHHGLDETVMDRAMSAIKDFFGIGLSLVTAAMGVLRFQSKNGNDQTQNPPAGGK